MSSIILKRYSGFTIVELLVVIVVVGILAAVTIVAYSGVTSKAVVASIQSDLTSSAQKLKLYYAEYGTYPQSLDGDNCPTAPTANSRYCLKASSGNTLTYCPAAPYDNFALKNTNNNGTSYLLTDDSAPFASGSSTAILSTGGTITTTGCGKTHTFDTSCTGASPCVVTAATSGKMYVIIKGAGGGGNNGSAGGNSSITYNSINYVANGGTGAGGAGSTSSPGGWTATAGGGSAGGVGDWISTGGYWACDDWHGDECYSPADDYHDPGWEYWVPTGYYANSGGNGGKLEGVISINTGQTVSIVVGAGGSGGASGSNGSVTISYAY